MDPILKIFHKKGFIKKIISYKSLFTGLGYNQDYYGPKKIFKQNFGLFLGYRFI
jgi:hypothetical protein